MIRYRKQLGHRNRILRFSWHRYRDNQGRQLVVIKEACLMGISNSLNLNKGKFISTYTLSPQIKTWSQNLKSTQNATKTITNS